MHHAHTWRLTPAGEDYYIKNCVFALFQSSILADRTSSTQVMTVARVEASNASIAWQGNLIHIECFTQQVQLTATAPVCRKMLDNRA